MTTASPMATHTPDPVQQVSSSSTAPKREKCTRCRRPQRVCLCAALPATPIQLAGRVIILQHPHEAKIKLATVPLLQQYLSCDSLHVFVGRRLRPGQHKAFDETLHACQQQEVPLLVLWPGTGAVCITEVPVPALTQKAKQQQQQQQTTVTHPQGHLTAAVAAAHHTPSTTCRRPPPAYVLLVVDSTWRFAREMFDGLQWVMQPQGPGVQVQLPLQSSTKGSSSSNNSSSSSRDCSDMQQLLPVNPAGCSSPLQSATQEQQQQQQVLLPSPETQGVAVAQAVAWPQASSANVMRSVGTLTKCLEATHLQPALDAQQQQHNHHRQQKQQQQQQQDQQQLQQQQQRQHNDPGVTHKPCDSTAARASHDLSSSSSSSGGSSSSSGGGGGGGCLSVAGLPDAGCRLRTEPHESCCTTYEAVARAVSCLEGPELLPILLKPLQLLTHMQAQFDPALRQRVQQSSSAVVQTKSKLGMRNRLDFT